MSGTGESLVRAERAGRLLVVRMCRESKRNAVNRQLADELDAAFNLLEDDDGLWAGVLTGTGSVFSAGSDLTKKAVLLERGLQITRVSFSKIGKSNFKLDIRMERWV